MPVRSGQKKRQGRKALPLDRSCSTLLSEIIPTPKTGPGNSYRGMTQVSDKIYAESKNLLHFYNSLQVFKRHKGVLTFIDCYDLSRILITQSQHNFCIQNIVVNIYKYNLFLRKLYKYKCEKEISAFHLQKMGRRKQRRDTLLFDKIILRVKELRGIHGHSQEQLKENTGLDIANLEAGENFPSITSISILCKFYNLTLDEFFAPMNYPPKE